MKKVSVLEAFCYDEVMNKKLTLIVIALIVLLSAALLVWFFISQHGSKANSNQGTPISAMSIQQARALHHTSTCLANNTQTKTTVESLPGLGEDSGIYTGEIYDVPAGTNVDVSVASYDEPSSTIGGSLAYSNQYGSYNFLLQKQSDGWRYVAFIRCG